MAEGKDAEVSGSSRNFVEGQQVRVTTTLGEKFDGQVIAFDEKAKCVVFQDIGASGSRRSLRFVVTSYIEDVKLIGKSESPLDLQISHIDLTFVKAREEAAIRQAEADAQRIGVGVSEEAQDIFDALSRTLPVRWDKTTIVVMDDVRVSGAYRPENVVGGTSAANERVRKVLEYERKRLEERASQ